MTFAVGPAIVCGLLGLLLGTFLQDVVRRMASRQRLLIVTPHCYRCGVAMQPGQRIPWLARFGNNSCIECSNPLWPAFPGMELFTALVFGVVGARTGWVWDLPAMLVFALAMVAVVVIDRRSYIIPNRIVYPALFATLVLLAGAALLEGSGDNLLDALMGMAGAWLFFAIVWLINPRGIGFGDVRLSAIIGLVAGWVGIGNVVLAVFIGLLFGAIGGLVMVVAQRAGMRDPIPFGPFLVAGAFVAVYFGESVGFVLG